MPTPRTAQTPAHETQVSRATRFRELNRAGRLLLPNAWDGVSARIFEEAGFPAIATTSAGIAFTRGMGDAEKIERDVMVRELASIVAAVSIPVSADIEAGYGPTPSHVAASVDAVIDVGVIGVNIEDGTHDDAAPLFPIEDQKARLVAARAAADRRGLPLTINARTDGFISSLRSDVEACTVTTIERGRAYLAAGADLVFIPGVVDPALVRRLAEEIGGPISLMAGPGAPPAEDLFAAGASRVSLGPTAMLATLGLLRTIAGDLRTTGTFASLEREDFLAYRDAEALFAGR